ncbi:MAG: DUF721 domain-containing protein, partial [Treponemataceae bacterium]
GIMRTAKGYSEFFSSWKGIVGDHLSAHSRIVELDKTVLVVEADHPGWIQLIQMKRTTILESIRRQFPELTVTAISIKLRKSGSADLILQKTKRPIEIADTEKSTIVEAPGEDIIRDPYAKISDESFKDLLRRLEQSIKKGSR